jgi:hypothetical protein
MKSKLVGNKEATICLDLSSSTPYKLKKSIIDALLSKGVRVSFVLNSKCSCVLKNADSASDLDTYKCRTAFKMGIPVIGAKFISELLNGNCKEISGVQLEKYALANKLKEKALNKGVIATGNFIYTVFNHRFKKEFE